MPGIRHSVVATKPNNPNVLLSTNAWNSEHTIDDGSIPLTKLENPVIKSAPPSGNKKKIVNLYWDADTQEIVVEYEA
jgi:hypothetical protein